MKVSIGWQVAMAVMMILALSVPLAEAQQGRGQGGRGRGQGGQGRGPGDGQGGRRYDATTEVTITGAVDEVLMQAGRGGATGLHLLVAAEGETFDVHVGPTFYLFPAGLEVEKGDQITVTGSRVVVDEKPALIVKEITEGDFTLALRDEAGLPLWRGQGPRSGQGGRGPGGGAAVGTVGNGRGSGRGYGRGYGRGVQRGLRDGTGTRAVSGVSGG